MGELGVVRIEAVCLTHPGSGHLLVRREQEGRIVLAGHADHCCEITLRDPAAIQLFHVLGGWLG